MISSTDFVMIQNSFDFVLFFSIDKVRRWVRKAWPMDVGLSEW